MIQNEITPISKEYIQSDRVVELNLIDLEVKDLLTDNVSILLKYQSKIFEKVGEVKGDLKQATLNFSPISNGVSKALNSTIVNSTTGSLIGEFDYGNQIRDLVTKEIIGSINLETKQFQSNEVLSYDEETNEPILEAPISVEGEATFLVNLIRSNTIPIDTLIHQMFDRLINLNLI